MSMTSLAQLFAARGDEWNARNPQHNAGQTVRIRRRPDGSLLDVEVEWDVEGYDFNPPPYQRPPEPRVQVQRADPTPRLRCRRVSNYRPPEYRSLYGDGRKEGAVEKPLTPEQQQLRKKQRAQVKARLTRAANKLKRAEDERQQLFAQLVVKLSQGAK